MITTTHKIGGIVFRTESNVRLPRVFEKPFDIFQSTDTKPDIYQCFYKTRIDKPFLSNHGCLGQLLRSGYISPDHFKSPILQSKQVIERLDKIERYRDDLDIRAGDHYIVIRDFRNNRLEIFYTEKFGGYVPERHEYMPESYVASNLREMISSFLPGFSAILLHSSGVIRKNRAAIFLGPDGIGKTTVIRNSNGEQVLSGDQIMLRKEKDKIMAHATPLGGLTSGSCTASVGALFMLERAPSFKLEAVSPSEAIQCLWTEHHSYTSSLPKKLKQTAFRILGDLCYRIPVYLMRVQKDFVDWEAIDLAMECKLAK